MGVAAPPLVLDEGYGTNSNEISERYKRVPVSNQLKRSTLGLYLATVVLFIAWVMFLRTRRLFLRLKPEEVKERPEVILIKVSLSANDTSQSVDKPETEPVAV
jgi:hypothetical protein